MKKPAKKPTKQDAKIAELTADLQRIQADFENYRKRAEEDKSAARVNGAERAVLQLLPVVDNIERATAHTPADIAEHPWVKGVGGITKQLDKVLVEFGLSKIDASPGAEFDPELHQAVQLDEDAEGDTEVIAEELSSGYMLNGSPIRHSMVKVTKK